MSRAWPPDSELRLRLKGILDSPDEFPDFAMQWQGIAYRFASLAYSDNERFTDGEGARRHGGRFTPIGGQRTLYLSLDRATAMAELDSWYDYYSVPDSAFKPRVLAAVAVSAGLLLDLASPEVLRYLTISEMEIHKDWRPISDAGGMAPTQTFGRLVYEAGFEGVHVASVRRAGGYNLALFPDNYRVGTHSQKLN